VSLANQLSAEGHDAQAIEGEKSQFDVLVDGNLVFSKQRQGRFPDDGEISLQLS
jgi:predicted Rdx family selenoprotein